MVLNPITRSADFSSAINVCTSFSQYTAKSLRVVDHVTAQASSNLEASRPPTSWKSFWLSRSKYTRFMGLPVLLAACAQNRRLLRVRRFCRLPELHGLLPAVGRRRGPVRDSIRASNRCHPAGVAGQPFPPVFPNSFPARAGRPPARRSRFPASACRSEEHTSELQSRL